MTKIVSVVFLLFLFVKGNSQNKNLIGTWILDKVFYANGKDMEVNNEFFSYKMIYQIAPNRIAMNDYLFDAVFSDKQIQIGNRKMDYEFRGHYLLVKDVDDNKIYSFLKRADFIKKFPEFQPHTEIRDGDTLLVANSVTKPIFNSEITFSDFLNKNMFQGSSKNEKDLYFEAEYIVTKENKIKSISIIDGRNKRYDSEFILALKKAEVFVHNPYGQDLLVKKEVDFLRFFKDLELQDEKSLFKIIEKGEFYYNKQSFQKAATEFEKIASLEIGENKYRMAIADANLKLAISYLGTNQIDKACTTLKNIGDKTNFNIRNYLINFCEK
mgnify:CR=1 FL=1